jgi:hypothetical protein
LSDDCKQSDEWSSGRHEHYLTTIDDNSASSPCWKGRNGGDVDRAASECIATMVDTSTGRRRPATQRDVRHKLVNRISLINKGPAKQS